MEKYLRDFTFDDEEYLDQLLDINFFLAYELFFFDKGQGRPWPGPGLDLLDRANADLGQGRGQQNWVRAGLD